MTSPVIVSTHLSPNELSRLLEKLRLHRGPLGYSIKDIKGLNPAIYAHRIHFEEHSNLPEDCCRVDMIDDGRMRARDDIDMRVHDVFDDKGYDEVLLRVGNDRLAGGERIEMHLSDHAPTKT
jgi:hypothetical protein